MIIFLIYTSAKENNFSTKCMAILDCVGKQRLINYDNNTVTEVTHIGGLLSTNCLSSSHV